MCYKREGTKTKNQVPLKFAQELTSVVALDRSGRRVSGLCRPEYWQMAAEKISTFSKVAVVSGFFVPSAGAAETDGPGGAVMLARAFLEQGAAVEIWTDHLCLDVFRACAASAGLPPECVNVAEADEVIDSFSPDGIIFIERLGRAADGNYYNIRKNNISAWTPKLDGFAIACSDKNISTIGIGDGGNEVGMGNFISELYDILPDYRECLSVIRTDIAIPADVSNWGGYALVAALSHIWGVWRGHRGGDERAMMDALVRSGAVDGISRRVGFSVDGLPLKFHEAVVSGLFDIWKRFQI